MGEVGNMCQAKPGLRCSRHAQQKVTNYENKVQEKREALATGKHSETEERSLRRSLEGYSAKLKEAKYEYSLTSRGVQELANKVRATKPGVERTRLEDELRHARKIRNRRNAAMARIREEYYLAITTPMSQRKVVPQFQSADEAAAYVTASRRDERALRNSLQEFLETSGSRSRVTALAEVIGETSAMTEYGMREHDRLEREDREAVEPIRSNLAFEGYASFRGVDYDYETKYSCFESGCDTICRCGQLVNVRVESVNAEEVLKELTHRSSIPPEIVQYARDLGFEDTDNWRIEVVNGYYGEEIGGIIMDNDTIKTQLSAYIDDWNAKHRS